MFSEGRSDAECVAAGFDEAFVIRVRDLNNKSGFKRRMPLIAALPSSDKAGS
jgi:hypothetical protein